MRKALIWVACLVDKLLGAVDESVCISFEDAPLFRRVDLVDGRLVHERLQVLEEADNVINELTRLLWRRVVETADSLLKQHAPDRCTQLQNRN